LASEREPTPETGVTDAIIRDEVRSHWLARFFGPVRRLYEWILGWAETRHAGRAMAALACSEAIFFPVPADLLLMALCLGRPKRSFWWATICTAWSIVGGTSAMLLGMAIGQARVTAALGMVGLGDEASVALDVFGDWGFWAIAVAALTPVPYMVFSWVAGFAGIPLWQFIVASLVFRSLRFFGVGALVYVFGRAAKRFIDRYFNLATVLLMLLVIGVVILVKVLRG